MAHPETPLGQVGRKPLSIIADNCARVLLDYASPRAVTMDPTGRVFVESVKNICDEDLIGVFQRDLGLLELNRRIYDNLKHEAGLRGIDPARQNRFKRSGTFVKNGASNSVGLRHGARA